MFVVCGEALMDVFGAERHAGRHGARRPHRRLAVQRGAGAGAARRSRSRSSAACPRGFLGERLMRALRDEGIAAPAASRAATRRPRSAWSSSTRTACRAYAFYGERGADRQLPPAALAQVPPQARALSLRLVRDGGRAGRVDAARAGRARAWAAPDRLRPEHPPERRARHRALARACSQWMLPRTHLLKISEEDLALLYPGADVDGAGGAVAGAGRRAGRASRAAREGALAWCGAGARRGRAPVRCEVVDTVGAGDTSRPRCWPGWRKRALIAPRRARER